MTTRQSILVTTIAATFGLTSSSELLAASIGINFVDSFNSGVQNGQADSLAAGEIAGASGYAQPNWNNYGRWSGLTSPNDDLGVPTSVAIGWDANNTYGTGSGSSTPDNKLMNGYLDSTGQANQSSFSSVYASNANKPLVFITGVSSWLSSQSASTFDLVLYVDGDGTDGRVGEYWLQSATGSSENSFTLGSDLTSHIFTSDTANFGGSFVQVSSSATSLGSASPGNYIVFSGIPATADTFLIRTEEQNFRSNINAFQIVATAVPEPSTVGLLGLGLLGVIGRRNRRWSGDLSAGGGVETSYSPQR